MHQCNHKGFIQPHMAQAYLQGEAHVTFDIPTSCVSAESSGLWAHVQLLSALRKKQQLACSHYSEHMSVLVELAQCTK